MVDFIFVIIEVLLLSLTAEMYKRKSVKVGIFEGGGSVSARKGTIPSNLCWSGKTRDCLVQCWDIDRGWYWLFAQRCSPYDAVTLSQCESFPMMTTMTHLGWVCLWLWVVAVRLLGAQRLLLHCLVKLHWWWHSRVHWRHYTVLACRHTQQANNNNNNTEMCKAQTEYEVCQH